MGRRVFRQDVGGPPGRIYRDTIREVSRETTQSVPEVRLSDAEREAIIDRLKLAQDEGRLDLHEYEDRVGQVYAAKVSSEISAVLHGLPAITRKRRRRVRSDKSAPVAVPVEPIAANSRRWMFALLSSRKSSGRWIPGAPNKTLTVLGSQTLDLTAVDALEVDIRSYVFFGETKIIVPPGAHVDVDGFIFLGGTSNKSKVDEGNSPMQVRVRTRGIVGECRVRTPGTGAALKKAVTKRIRGLA